MVRFIALSALLALVLFVPAAHSQITVEQLLEQSGITPSGRPLSDSPDWAPVKKIVLREGIVDVAKLRELYSDVEFVSVTSSRNAAAQVADADALIGQCNAALVAGAKRLRWVQRLAAGVEGCVEVPEIASGQVILTNMQKIDSPIIAEHAIAMMMSLSRGLPGFARAMDDGVWDRSAQVRSKMTSVVGKKLLVVGLGGIGTEVARFGAALGMQVSATRNSSRSGPDFVSYVGLTHELGSLAAKADVVVSALPLTAATTDLFDQAFFSGLKSGAIFINVGRGKSVVTNDLLAALRSGHLGGAGLDVTAPEPLPADHPLWTLANVIITPHLSSGGGERERRSVLLMENLRRFIEGDRLLNVVDPTRGY